MIHLAYINVASCNFIRVESTSHVVPNVNGCSDAGTVVLSVFYGEIRIPISCCFRVVCENHFHTVLFQNLFIKCDRLPTLFCTARVTDNHPSHIFAKFYDIFKAFSATVHPIIYGFAFHSAFSQLPLDAFPPFRGESGMDVLCTFLANPCPDGGFYIM